MVTSDSTKKVFAYTEIHVLNQKLNSLHGLNGVLALSHAVVVVRLPVQESVWVVQHVSVIPLKPKKASVVISHALRSNNALTSPPTAKDSKQVSKIQSLVKLKPL